ncbi:TPA: integrating conjugative element protein [Salmonella enterica]|uniref:integrating conjugative element protein n=1 Tax=Salmonella enterica TaxID=28901 RepID=UPI0009B092DE|nr:integrating conjugative element protein [Salmonella enterica]HBD1844114.1 integrating conjugative element protein [Salmonella enterica]
MKIYTFLLTSFLCSSPVLAELKVIADLGGNDAAIFYEGINRQAAPVTTSAPSSPEGEAAMLPVVTPEMSPGPVAARELQLPGIGALFLIGDDPQSRTWLSRYAVELEQLQAVGLIVNVDHLEGVKALRSLAPMVQMVPASGGELARRLGLSHYPVLIRDTGLTQKVVP